MIRQLILRVKILTILAAEMSDIQLVSLRKVQVQVDIGIRIY